MSRLQWRAASRRVRAILLLGCLSVFLRSPPLAAQSVGGELVEEGTALPIEGAFVVLLDESGTSVAGTLTDGSGSFLLTAPSAGRFSVGPGTARTLIPTLCPAAEGASAESVVLGTVQEADGDQPVEGAIVHLSTHVLGVLAAPLDLEKISAWKVAGIAGPESASRFETVADRHGNFLLCGIPAGLRLYAGAIDPREGAARSRILYFTTRPGTHMSKLRMAPRPELSEGS